MRVSGSGARGAAIGVAAALVVASTVHAADPPRTYVRLAEEQDGPVPDLLRGLDDALGLRPDQAAVVLDRLLEEASAPGAAGWVVDAVPGTPGSRWLGLRSGTIARALAAPPPVLEALRALQDKAAAGYARTPAGADPVNMLRRHPFSLEGAAAARRLLGRAVACGDGALARGMVRALDRLHRGATPSAGERANRALACALAGDAQGVARELAALKALPATDANARADDLARTTAAATALLVRFAPPGLEEPPASARLTERWAAMIGETSQPEGAPAPALTVVPLSGGGGRVVASTGVAVQLLGLDGSRIGRLPHGRGTTSAPLDPSAVAPRPAVTGELVFVPLTLERWLVPGRLAADPGDAAYSGRWLSLVGLDLRGGRLRYWDGDAAAKPPRAGRDDGGPPPGLERAGADLLASLRRAHVIACAADAARVYVALLPKAKEPELLVFAYAREPGGGGVALAPVWARPVSLFAAERPGQVNTEDEPVAPEIGAALAPDGDGRLVVTTDVGVTAALDVATGQLEWVSRAARQEGGVRRNFPGRARVEVASVPPQPARFLAGPDGPCAGALQGDEVVALDLADGARRGASARGTATRTLVVGGHLLAYGENDLLVLEPRTFRLRLRAALAPGAPVVGELVAVGRTLVAPMRAGGSVSLRRFDLGLDQAIVAVRPVGTASILPATTGSTPVNLALAPGGGVVAASARRVSLHGWEP